LLTIKCIVKFRSN